MYTEGGEYRRLEYCTDQFTSTTLNSDNPATVAVLDGASILLTPFKHLNVPPPMSAVKAALSSPAAHVTFSPDGHGDDFAVLMCDSTVQLFQSQSFAKPVKAPSPSVSFSLSTSSAASRPTFRQLTWVTRDEFLAIAYNPTARKDVITAFKIDNAAAGGQTASATDIYSSPARIVRLHHSAATNTTLFETVQGKLWTIGRRGDAWAVTEFGSFPAVCPWIAIVAIGKAEKEVIPIGLTERNKLYLGSEVLSPDCTSFFVHDSFLIFTTLTHAARFVPTNVATGDFKVLEAAASAYDETNRRVERGSKIVIAVPGSIALVLQMPRGNLETIYPRALILSTVRTAFANLDFRTAFLLCRKHRIDMNLLVDLDRERFMTNVETFVRQVDDPEYLNLFVSGLRNEDVTRTMYPGSGKAVETGTVEGDETTAIKVNTVATAVCDTLMRLDEKKYVYTILTTYAKQVPPRLEEAMGRILEIKDKESSSTAESALKYLIFLADVDKLYDVALGMYDFALVLMVAQHSQKDPREYLPFLSELQKLEKNYQRFKIDDHLGKKEKALRSLSLAGDSHHTEVLEYIKRNSLHKAAVEVYKEDPVKQKAVMKLWAEDLQERGTYDEAALLYVMADEKRSAMECYRQAGLWQEAMAIAFELNIEEEEIVWMASELADELAEQRKYAESARLLLDYAQVKPKEAVQTLVKGSLWSEASRVAHTNGLSDMIESTVKPGILEGCSQLLDDIRDMRESFAKQRERLNQVRDEKARKAADAENAPHDDRLDNIDLLSDTTSMATTRFTGSTVSTGRTGSTARTGKSSKIRRKHERKRAAGKSKEFEEEFLVSSLRKTIVKCDALRKDILLLVRALISIGEWERAKEVQGVFKEFVDILEKGGKGVFVLPTQAVETAEEFKIRVLEGRPPPPPPVPKVEDLPPVKSDVVFGMGILE
ncbi:hypothetical protein HDV00_005666 [Rhizophlyctis rosea]|nr:hypothetical protein HDV00_005666 [Rhizophlyctis rosea]